MAANEVHSLAVRLTPEGADETRTALKDTREEFETTTDEVGESAGILDDFANKWTGAGLVFAGTFGTLTAAIASRMPILSEVSNSLDQVLTSLALAIDEDVRPGVQGLSRDFSDLAGDIDDADSSAEAFGITARGLTEISIDIVLDARAKETGPSRFEQFREDFDDFASGFLGKDIEEFREDVDTAFNNAVAGWRTGLEVGWELIVNDAKKSLNALGQQIERRLNQIVKAFNSVTEATGITLNRVSIGQFETESRESIINRGRARLAARRGDLDVAGGGRAGGISSQDIDRLVAALQGADNTTEVNVNDRTIAQTVQPALGSSVANRGR